MPTMKNNSEKRVLPKLAYSVRETCQMLGLCRLTVYKLIKRGLLGSTQTGPGTCMRLIPRADIERFLNITPSKGL